MKRILRVALASVAVALVLVAVAGCGNSGNSGSTDGTGTSTGGATPTGTSVTIKDFAFSPASVDVKVGESVTWKNEDSATHNVEGDGGISSGDLANGQTYTKTFDTAGTYAYKCAIHPNMTGTVVVK